MSKEYPIASDDDKAPLAPGQFMQLRFYKNGEMRVDFDPRIDKLPVGQEDMMRLLGGVTAALMEVTSWATQSLRMQDELKKQLGKALKTMETGPLIQ